MPEVTQLQEETQDWGGDTQEGLSQGVTSGRLDGDHRAENRGLVPTEGDSHARARPWPLLLLARVALGTRRLEASQASCVARG